MSHWPGLRCPNEAASGLYTVTAIRQNAQKVLIKCSVDFQLTQHPSAQPLPAASTRECVYTGLIRVSGQTADPWLVTNTEQRKRGSWWDFGGGSRTRICQRDATVSRLFFHPSCEVMGFEQMNFSSFQRVRCNVLCKKHLLNKLKIVHQKLYGQVWDEKRLFSPEVPNVLFCLVRTVNGDTRHLNDKWFKV